VFIDFLLLFCGRVSVYFCVLKMSPPKFPPSSLGFLWFFVVGLSMIGSKFPPRSLGPSVAVFTRLVWVFGSFSSFRVGADHLVGECTPKKKKAVPAKWKIANI
jgi:hypothetical protein